MSTDLGRKYTPDWNGTPPRMSKEDLQIWRRYKPTIEKEISWVFYDVGLGEGQAAGAEATTAEKQMWKAISQKRADVIAQTKSEVWIIEIRYSAESNGAGRLQMYRMLYLRDPILGLKYRLKLVTNKHDQDTADLCKQLDIDYIVI